MKGCYFCRTPIYFKTITCIRSVLAPATTACMRFGYEQGCVISTIDEICKELIGENNDGKKENSIN